jgi:predicted ATPase/class 3 adenylate cyclase
MDPSPAIARDVSPLPSGTAAFLFTDIEGSTQRWDRYPDHMKAAVGRHDEILRSVMSTHDGHVFKTVGDGFCVAFGSAENGVAAAVAAQRALSAQDFSSVDGLRVRMGMHVGEASERNDDYFGPTVNRVARLMSIGHGGQILISEAVYGSVNGEFPSGASAIDLGSRQLKDLLEPERVWQITIAGLPGGFPPLHSLDARPNNLPIQINALIGREDDLAELKALLNDHRVSTLCGAGGVGKTRLALQAGADLIDRFEDGVWFADLSPIRDAALVASVVGQVLGITAADGNRLDETIAAALKEKRLLLILDNCEQVVDAAAALVAAIQASAPGVRVLATSRQPLGISGEAAYRLPSLAVPQPEIVRADDALAFGAIGVFVDRATLADSRFVLTDDNAPIVAEICRRLDGIPLAIELAAARVKILSVPNLAKRLDDRFKILTAGSRTALPRQRTLGALIDWSYELLSAAEQALFDRLGIFAGGFSLDAAAIVCGPEGADPADILDIVASLTDKSLIVADTSGEQERFRLLESTRAYSLEKLERSGGRERQARRHAEYFRDQARLVDAVKDARAREEMVEHDIDNFRAALDWALTRRNDATLGAAIAGSLGRAWVECGLVVEGRYWIRPALERIDEGEQPHLAARLWSASALLTEGPPSLDAARHATELYRRIGDLSRVGDTLQHQAYVLNTLERMEEARDAAAGALAAYRAAGDRAGAATALNRQAMCEAGMGQIDVAREHYAEALSAFRAAGNDTWTAMTLDDLAWTEFQAGDPELALALSTEALGLKSHEKHAIALVVNHINSAAYLIALGDLGAARESASLGLQLARQVQDSVRAARAVFCLAILASLGGDPRRAIQLLGFVEARYRATGWGREDVKNFSFDGLVAAVRSQLGQDEIEGLLAEGAAWPEDRAVEEALRS